MLQCTSKESIIAIAVAIWLDDGQGRVEKKKKCNNFLVIFHYFHEYVWDDQLHVQEREIWKIHLIEM